MVIQFCGMSGSGKTTIANGVKQNLNCNGVLLEIIDGDEYRKVLCSDLGFSREDRSTNIRRLAFVASKLSTHNIVSIICAINPYDDVRKEIAQQYNNVKTIFISCTLDKLIERDTKGLYKRALLSDGHPDKIENLTGVNDPFECPADPDLVINTECETIEQSVFKVSSFILNSLRSNC